MSGFDIIALPGHAGMFARRVAVEAWQRAGSPRVNSAGRLYALQKYYWDGWRKRLPGFQPADNPDNESLPLAHCRFVAFDIDATVDRIKRLEAAGFVRPYSYEPWHWELPNVRSYSIVRYIPATSGGGFIILPEDHPLAAKGKPMTQVLITYLPTPAPDEAVATLRTYVGGSTLNLRAGVGVIALVGDAPGTPANVQLTQLDRRGNEWAADHTGALTPEVDGIDIKKGGRKYDFPEFMALLAAYAAPLNVGMVAAAPASGASKADVDAAAAKVIEAIPTSFVKA